MADMAGTAGGTGDERVIEEDEYLTHVLSKIFLTLSV
jgi:hypothetical protein